MCLERGPLRDLINGCWVLLDSRAFQYTDWGFVGLDFLGVVFFKSLCNIGINFKPSLHVSLSNCKIYNKVFLQGKSLKIAQTLVRPVPVGIQNEYYAITA